MILLPPISTRTDTLFPHTTLFRSALAVLLLDRSQSFGRGESIIGKLLRIEPDTHRIGRREHLDVTDAFDAAQFVDYPRSREIAQFKRPGCPGLRADRKSVV